MAIAVLPGREGCLAEAGIVRDESFCVEKACPNLSAGTVDELTL